MNKRTWLIGALAVAPLAFVAAVCGNETTRIETPPNGQMTGISVTGEGKVSAPPDLAIVSLGVSAIRPSVAEARESAAVALQGMIDSMKANGVEVVKIADRKPFQDAVKPVWEKYGAQHKALIERIQAVN